MSRCRAGRPSRGPAAVTIGSPPIAGVDRVGLAEQRVGRQRHRVPGARPASAAVHWLAEAERRAGQCGARICARPGRRRRGADLGARARLRRRAVGPHRWAAAAAPTRAGWSGAGDAPPAAAAAVTAAATSTRVRRRRRPPASGGGVRGGRRAGARRLWRDPAWAGSRSPRRGPRTVGRGRGSCGGLLQALAEAAQGAREAGLDGAARGGRATAAVSASPRLEEVAGRDDQRSSSRSPSTASRRTARCSRASAARLGATAPPRRRALPAPRPARSGSAARRRRRAGGCAPRWRRSRAARAGTARRRGTPQRAVRRTRPPAPRPPHRPPSRRSGRRCGRHVLVKAHEIAVRGVVAATARSTSSASLGGTSGFYRLTGRLARTSKPNVSRAYRSRRAPFHIPARGSRTAPR